MFEAYRPLLEEVNSIVAPSWLVGGAVRDIIRGIAPDDFDFCTPMLPGEMEDCIKAADRHVYGVGKDYGTLEFKCQGTKVQVTTFRSEKYKDGSRHPEVAFVASLEDDLSRRDFTINALACSRHGDVLDLFGGMQDLLDETIRCVGKAKDRFKEDPLRMLRMCRFTAQLGFAIAPDTMEAARVLAPRITTVARERWVVELDKLLMAPHVHKGLIALEISGLLKFILPEVWLQVGYDQQTPYHSKPLWDHTMGVTESASKSKDLRWAALLHDVGKPFVARRKSKTFERNGEEVTQITYIDHAIVGAEIVRGIAARLHWSKVQTDTVYNLVLNHLNDDSPLREYDSKAR